MFWNKNKKNVHPCESQIFYIKVGFKGVYISRTCFPAGLTGSIKGFGYSKHVAGLNEGNFISNECLCIILK